MRNKDQRLRFLIESCDVRGQLVHLDQCWEEARARTHYPQSVQQALGEAFVAASLLAGTIKFDGKMTLQVRGPGPVYLMVVQVTRDGSLRGLARWHAEPQSSHLQQLFGDEATMVISIEANEHKEPYQGIVALQGNTLAEALSLYFLNSEQLKTELYFAVSDDTASGLLLQKLPTVEQAGEDLDGWQRAVSLAGTVTEAELRDIDADVLLTRLFHEEEVRVFDAEPLKFLCACSRERTDKLLLGLGQTEVQSIIDERGEVEITCEFCDAVYRYDAVDATGLFKGAGSGTGAADSDPEPVDSETRH